MSVRRSLSLLPAFALAGAGAVLLLVWIYYLLGWISTSSLLFQEQTHLWVPALLVGVGVGVLSWLGFAIGRLRARRAGRSSAAASRGAYLRTFALSLLVLLVLGTLYGLILTLPAALGQAAIGSGTGLGEALLTGPAYIVVFGSPAVLPLFNGLLTGGRARPGAVLAFFGSLALALGGLIVYLLPLILLIHLVPPACSKTVPESCGPWHFGPSFEVEVLGLVAVWAAITVSFASGAAAAVGVLVAGLTDRP